MPVNNRPSTLSAEHQYNLFNQGWSNVPAAAWTATDTSAITVPTTVGVNVTFTVGTDISGITEGESVVCGTPDQPYGVYGIF